MQPSVATPSFRRVQVSNLLEESFFAALTSGRLNTAVAYVTHAHPDATPDRFRITLSTLNSFQRIRDMPFQFA